MRQVQFSRTVNSTLQNRINRSIIFNCLRLNGPSHRAGISKSLGISVPAVSRAIDSLIKEGYVVQTGLYRAANGKLITQFAINSGKGIVIGIDLIKENIEIAVSDLGGKILLLHRGFRFEEGIDVPARLSDEVETVLRDFGTQAGMSRGLVSLKAIGIGVPAVTDVNTGAVTDAPLYGSLAGLNLKDEMSRRFSVPVYVENVVRMSALGEKHSGEGRKYKDMVFFEVSNGIGAGIIIDNHIARGFRGSAGEVGFSVFDPRNIGFRDNTKGFLEAAASVESIAEQARRRLEQESSSELAELSRGEPSTIDAHMVCIAANSGDRLAAEILKEIVEYLSLSIIQLTLILNPQLVVLGGDLCRLPHVDTLFVKPILENVTRAIPFQPPVIKLSALGEKAGVVGATILATEYLLSGEFPYSIDDCSVSDIPAS
jgi:N-acetylglucosamine repressor